MAKSLPKISPLPLAARIPASLYIHIPFCARRCPYCDFAVSEKRHVLEKNYMKALISEMHHRLPPNFRARTIFIGGGTPTELNVESLQALSDALKPYISGLREFSIEANPGTLTEKKLAVLKEMGVTRVSLGSQSLENSVLERLGRFHKAEQTERSVAMLRGAGFENLNLDLIFGVPEQSLDDLIRDLSAYIDFGVPHISAYGLTFEEGTPFFSQRESGQLKAVRQSLEAQMFHEIRQRLGDAGFSHYEISNSAQPGHACAHNRVYGRHGGYYGLGNSAASHISGQRVANTRDVEDYIAQVSRNQCAFGETDTLDRDAKIREYVYLALRSARGLQRTLFLRDLGEDVMGRFEDAIAKHLKYGLLETCPDGYRLSARGLPLADTIAVDFL
ncbi:MAG: radical SAM family heme chaperone HemW [Planctomycetota bacterium]|nr:radical SAM family heme chaperone HemW [Planctomycetota bacterium]